MQPRAGRQTAYCACTEELVIDIAVAAPTARNTIGMNETHIGLLRIFSLRRLLRCPSSVKPHHGGYLGWINNSSVRTNVVFFAK